MLKTYDRLIVVILYTAFLCAVGLALLGCGKEEVCLDPDRAHLYQFCKSAKDGEKGDKGDKGDSAPVSSYSVTFTDNVQCKKVETIYAKRNNAALNLYPAQDSTCAGATLGILDADDEVYWISSTIMFSINTSNELFIIKFE